jgi:predicted branched-subunit amino acid permease
LTAEAKTGGATPSPPPPATPQSAPAWAEGATKRTAYLRGLLVALSAPALVLFTTATGFGALARDLDFTLGHALAMSLLIYALPAQVMLVDQLARGAALAAAAFAVTLTAIRLLPMTITLFALIREDNRIRPIHIAAGHLMAVTVWLEGSRRLPLLPVPLRLPHFFGIGSGMFLSTALGSVLGYTIAGALPPAVVATLLFMTPIYFLLSLLVGATKRMDWLAIGFGLLIGPPLFLFLPGPDLMLTGLVGGTAAYLIGRQQRGS